LPPPACRHRNRRRKDDWLPSEPAQLNLEAANVTPVLWATGYRLDFSILATPVLDEWNYPRHYGGVIEHPGYAVGLPCLTGHGSFIVAGVGRDAEYIGQHIAEHFAARRRRRSRGAATPRQARRSPRARRGRPL
ncbi:MAG: hypothetical protein ABWX72_19485, partial [Arthrobacter sp.]